MKRKNAFRILFPVILITIFSALVVLLSSSWLNKNVRSRLQNEFSKQAHGKYKLEIDALKLNVLTMSVRLKGITIDPDKIGEDDAAYSFSTKELSFNGVGLLKFLMNKHLNINTVKLLEPSIKLVNGTNEYKTESDSANRFSLYGFVSTFAKSITFDKLSVVDFDLTLYNDQKDDAPSLKSTENSFRIRNFHIGSSTLNLPGFFEADTIVLQMKHFTYTQPDSLYTFSVGQLKASFRDSTLLIDSISFKPNFSKRKFGTAAGKQTDRLDIQAQKLQLSKIDLRRFLEYHSLIARSGNITALLLIAHRDHNDIRVPKQPPSLQKILKDSPLYIKIDILNLNDATVIYEEVAKGNTLPGRVTFNDINGKFTGITNDSLLIKTGAELVFEANCRIMDEGKLKAYYRFPLDTDITNFDCTGYLTGMSMKTLNGVLEPLAGISVKEGYIDSLDFSFHAGENTSNGTMKFLYHDLEIGLSDKGPGNIGANDKFKMFVADKFVIINDNPEKRKAPRNAQLYSERNKQRFMFNYTWRTILSGLRETIGIPENSKL